MTNEEFYKKVKNDKKFAAKEADKAFRQGNLLKFSQRINDYAREAYLESTGKKLEEIFLEHLPGYLVFGKEYVSEMQLSPAFVAMLKVKIAQIF